MHLVSDMIITDSKSAKAFVAAWQESSPRRRANMFKIAREAQCANAGMAYVKGDTKAERSARAAQRVLERAERNALCEALNVPVDCVATTSELWLDA